MSAPAERQPAIQAPDLEDERVIRAVQEYLAKLEAGQAPTRQEFLDRHGDIAEAVAACLDGLEFVHDAASGLLPRGEAEVWEQSGQALSGTPLGDYRIIREVGRGGMGIVYEAEQLSLGRRVALKVLPFAAVFNPRHFQRFKHEAQAAAHLHHTNIVPVHAIGCERGVHYYAMQFIEGQSLAQVVRELRHAAGRHTQELVAGPGPVSAGLASGQWAPRLSEESDAATNGAALSTRSLVGIVTERSSRDPTRFRSVAQLGVQAAEALAYAHAEGVIHRDIKPANLLVNAQGRLWVTDFGLARFHGDACLTRSGDVVGTIRYMSPEQSLGRPDLDHRTDIYSLGATLYEMLTLEPACAGVDSQDLLRRITSDEPVRPRHRDRAIPVELETIVLKAIAKEPDARYSTAQDLADDLRRFLEDRPIVARRPTLPQRAAKWARRHRALVRVASVSVLVLFVAMAVCLAIIWRQKEQILAALDAEADQRRRAEQNWRLALQALDTIYLQTAERQFPRDPQREKEDRHLLEHALRFYEQFVEANGAQAAVRRETAGAYLRVGEIYQRLGKANQAEQAYRRAVALLEELLAEVPTHIDYSRDWATAMQRMARLLGETGRLSEAEATYRALLERQKATAIAPGAEPDHRHELALTWNGLAVVLHRAGSDAEAESAWRDASTIWNQLAAEHPGIVRYRAELAGTQHNLASLMLNLGQFKQAEPLLRATLRVRRRLATETTLALDRQKLALTHHNLGILFKTTNRAEEATTEYREAISLGEQLVAEMATVPDLRYDLAGYHDHLGNALTDMKCYGEAENAYDKAQLLMDKLVADFPAIPKYREMLAITLVNQGILWKATERSEKAERSFVQARDLCRTLVQERPRMVIYRQHLEAAEKSLADLGKQPTTPNGPRDK